MVWEGERNGKERGRSSWIEGGITQMEGKTKEKREGESK